MPKLNISDFFNEDYVNYSSYDNLRKIASVVDGQKNGSRKVLYTILEHNIKSDIKVSQLGSKVAEFCLTGDTLVNTVKFGLMSLEEIISENLDEFEIHCVDSDGSPVTSTARHTRYMKDADVLIEIETENDTVRCTPDHKILVKDNDSVIWKEAQHLTTSDEIICIA